MARKRGIYAHLIDKLPKILGIDPKKQAMVEVIKEGMKKEPGFRMWSSDLAKRFALIRAEKAAAQATLAEIELRLEAVSQLMADQFGAEGLSNIGLANGGGVALYYEPTAKILDKEGFRLWCVEAGYVKSLHMHSGKMVSIVKERILTGAPEPAGLQVGSRRVIRLTKGDGEPDLPEGMDEWEPPED